MINSKRKVMALLAFFVSLTIVSCNFNPFTVVSRFISNPTETLEETTPLPEETEIPLLPGEAETEESSLPLTLYACPFYDQCPEASHISTFYEGDIQDQTEMYVEIPSQAAVRVNMGWFTIDEEHLSDNLESMSFFIKIDGVRRDDPSMFSWGTTTDSSGEYSGPGFFMGAVITGWVVGEEHVIEYGYTITDTINDGWDDYEPQTYTLTYRVMPIEDDSYTAPEETPGGVYTMNLDAAAADGS